MGAKWAALALGGYGQTADASSRPCVKKIPLSRFPALMIIRAHDLRRSYAKLCLKAGRGSRTSTDGRSSRLYAASRSPIYCRCSSRFRASPGVSKDEDVSGGFLPQGAASLRLLSIGVAASLLGGCAAGGGGLQSTGSQSTSQPLQAIAISTQPSSQTIPIGRAATFTVTANGAGPLQYQWSKDGAPIMGATSASYTTPAVALSDSGSTFQVTVSDATSSLASDVATLTAGPRAPALGDLRYLLFEQVTAAGFPDRGGEHTNILGSSSFWANDALGSPLEIGSNFVCYTGVAFNCAWGLTVFFLPAGQPDLSMYYEGHDYPDFSSDLQSIVAPNVVIDALDYEPSEDCYGISYVKTAQTGGFDYRLEVVPPDQLQTTVTNDGTESRVVTAVSFYANHQANVISYGWTGDTTTVYEAQTVIAGSASEIAGQATTLATNGYFISAFGGNDTDGYMLIGMRVQGDTMARPIYVTTVNPSGSSSANPLPQQNPPYYATEVVAGGFFGSFTTASSGVYASEE